MAEAQGNGEGRAWCRGDRVVLLRDWLHLPKGTTGTVLNFMSMSMRDASIVLVEWAVDKRGWRWVSIEDDLVARVTD
jgi:hypothetical protein